MEDTEQPVPRSPRLSRKRYTKAHISLNEAELSMHDAITGSESATALEHLIEAQAEYEAAKIDPT